MNHQDFVQNCPGKLVRLSEGGFAFVPDPLPPTGFVLDSEVANLVADAALAIGELKGVGSRLPNPHLLIGPLRTREARLSSRLEGTITTVEELLMVEAQPEGKQHRSEAFEVRNYITALEDGFERLNEIPISNRLIRELHGKLMHGVRGQEKRPGEFRIHQNAIGIDGQKASEARYVPPPVTELSEKLNEFEKYLHVEDELHPLIRLALLHYQFEAIHPFMDGNGRIGRLLIALLLHDWKLLPQPLLYMSSYFEKDKDTYKDLLFRVSQKASWKDWIVFFLRGIIVQSEDAILRSDLLLQLQVDYRAKIQSTRTSAHLLGLVDYLFEAPWTSAPHASKLLKITPPAAKKNIEKLVQAGILTEVTGASRGRIYIARQILEVANKDDL